MSSTFGVDCLRTWSQPISRTLFLAILANRRLYAYALPANGGTQSEVIDPASPEPTVWALGHIRRGFSAAADACGHHARLDLRALSAAGPRAARAAPCRAFRGMPRTPRFS